MNNSGPRYKRSQLEKDINKDVIACVFILFTLCLIGGGLVILAAAIVIMSTCRIRASDLHLESSAPGVP